MGTESRKEMEVATVRLENIKLKNKLKKKELQLKSKVQRHCGRILLLCSFTQYYRIFISTCYLSIVY